MEDFRWRSCTKVIISHRAQRRSAKQGVRSLPIKTVPSRRSIQALPAEGRPGPSDDNDDGDDNDDDDDNDDGDGNYDADDNDDGDNAQVMVCCQLSVGTTTTSMAARPISGLS